MTKQEIGVFSVVIVAAVAITLSIMLILLREPETMTKPANYKPIEVTMELNKENAVDEAKRMLDMKDGGWGFSRDSIIDELKTRGFSEDIVAYAEKKVLDKADFIEQARVCAKTIDMNEKDTKETLKDLGFTKKEVEEALKKA